MEFHKFPFDKQVSQECVPILGMTRITVQSNPMMMLVQVCQVKITSFSQSAKVQLETKTWIEPLLLNQQRGWSLIILVCRRWGWNGWMIQSPTLATRPPSSPSLTTLSSSSRSVPSQKRNAKCDFLKTDPTDFHDNLRNFLLWLWLFQNHWD